MPAWDEVGAAGLGLPAPPAALLEKIRAIGETRWGTRERTPGLRDLGRYAREFENGTDDYVLAGQVDAAINFPVTLYLLVYGNLGLFVEADARGKTERHTLEDAAELQRLYITAAANGRIERVKFLVVHSDISVTRWSFASDPPEGGIDPLWGVLEWLRDRTR